jgi:hypothetical protein
MAIFKSTPITKVINGITIQTSDVSVVTDSGYTTSGEYTIIVRDIPKCVITLDPSTTEHVTIKAMTDVLIFSSKEKIDDEYNEILIQKGDCVELRFVINKWYILSSDGLKDS